jgi:hypothetical protein
VHESPFPSLEGLGFGAESPQQTETCPLSIEDQVLRHRESKDRDLIVNGIVVGSSNEVVTSRLECTVAVPSLDQIHGLVQAELVLNHFSRELHVIEDVFEGASKLKAEFFDGFLVDRLVIGIDQFLLILILLTKAKRSSSSRHG